MPLDHARSRASQNHGRFACMPVGSRLAAEPDRLQGPVGLGSSAVPYSLEIVSYQPRQKEPAPDALLGGAAQGIPQPQGVDKLDDAPGTLVHVIYKKAVNFILDLGPNTPHVSANDRPAFPHSLGNGQPQNLPG